MSLKGAFNTTNIDEIAAYTDDHTFFEAPVRGASDAFPQGVRYDDGGKPKQQTG